MIKYSKILILLSIIGFVFCISARSQTVIDSLELELDNTHEIDRKIEIYLLLSKQHKTDDIDKAIEITNKALILATNTKTDSFLGLIYSYLGEYAILQDSISAGEIYFKKAKDYFDHSNPKELVSIYLSIGNRYIEKDNYAEAMKYYLFGIEISEQTGYTGKLANLYNNLGVVYLNTNNAEKALNLYSQALDLFKKEKDTMNIAGTTTNIGSIYIKLGQDEIAKTYYSAGYELFSECNSIEGMAHSLFKLGLLELHQSNYENAIDQLDKSLKLQKELEVIVSGSKSFFLAETYINLGIAHLNLSNHEQAKAYLLDGYKIAKNTHQNRLIANASEYLSKYYGMFNDYRTSLEYYQIFKQYSDSNFNEESVRKLTEFEMQHEFNAQLKEEELQRENSNSK